MNTDQNIYTINLDENTNYSSNFDLEKAIEKDINKNESTSLITETSKNIEKVNFEIEKPKNNKKLKHYGRTIPLYFRNGDPIVVIGPHCILINLI